MTWWAVSPPPPPPPSSRYYGDETLNDSYTAATEANRSGSLASEDDFEMTCRRLYDSYGPGLPPIHYLYLYAGSAIVAIGCVGQAVTASALLLSRPLRNQSLSPYLLVLSVAGVLALLTGLVPHVVWHGTCGQIQLSEQYGDSDFFCRTLMAARYYALHLYSWTEALIAAERMVAVRWPLQCKRWLTRRAGACIAAGTACVLLPVEAVPFVSYGYDNYFCVLVKEELYAVWPLTHLTVYCLAPVAVMLPSNALTLSAMRRSEFNSASLRRAKPVTVMMMTLNCLFIITAMPFVVAEFLHRNDQEGFAIALSMIEVSRLLLYAGSASTVFVYAIMAARFRKTLANFATRSFDRLCSVLSLPSMRVEAVTDVGGRERIGRTLRSYSCPDTLVSTVQVRTHSPLGENTDVRSKNSVG